MEDDGSVVPWIPLNPADPDLRRYPLFRHASPLTVTVKPGEMLFLPSMWFHQVAQRGTTVAVNHWFDMKFDTKFVSANVADKVGAALSASTADDGPEGVDLVLP